MTKRPINANSRSNYLLGFEEPSFPVNLIVKCVFSFWGYYCSSNSFPKK